MSLLGKNTPCTNSRGRLLRVSRRGEESAFKYSFISFYEDGSRNWVDPYSSSFISNESLQGFNQGGIVVHLINLELFHETPGYEGVSFVVWAPSRNRYILLAILITGTPITSDAGFGQFGCREIFIPMKPGDLYKFGSWVRMVVRKKLIPSVGL